MQALFILLLAIAVAVLWSRVISLEQARDRIQKELATLRNTRSAPREEAVPTRESPPATVNPARGWAAPATAGAPREGRASEPPPMRTTTAQPRVPREPGAIERAVRGYFTGGNLVVRVGIVVLFFGVGFLLKYAAERVSLSIQMRLAGVALGALVLFVIGWRLRHRRRGYALALQGGAVGVLYLTLFAALRLYHLLPASLTFALMAGLGVVACLLAVRQDSLAFSMLGAAGGFLAPLLASTGSGSHVVLFSYYALLTAFVVAQAWFKAWRPLNLLAFVFTFGVGAYWGAMRYEPALYASTQPFLLFFFLAFVAVAVLFALRRAPQLTHYVDGTLVFGTPVVAMALQMQLVRDFDHGRALSALAAGVFYLVLAAWLHRTRRESLRLLTESFIALGLAFLTLAVPLWFDDAWTSAIWALEGAALFWVGLRQERALATAAGVLLQVGAAAAFLLASGEAQTLRPVLNTQFMGAAVMAAAGLLSARSAMKPAKLLEPFGLLPSHLLLAWGLLWWLHAGWHDIDAFVSPDRQPAALLALCTVTALASGALARPLAWPALRVPALLLLPVLLMAALVWSSREWSPSHGGGWFAWPVALVVLWRILKWHAESLPGRWGAVCHGLTLWLVALLISWELASQVAQVAPAGTVWAGAAWALAPALLLVAIAGPSSRGVWPLSTAPREFHTWIALGLATVLATWAVWLNTSSSGYAPPVPHVPLLNPLDLATALALGAIAFWLRQLWQAKESLYPRETQYWLAGALVAVSFIWLNAVLLRAMHHWGGVAFELPALMSDTRVQAALSIFWTLLALGAMLWANRGAQRVVWFGGAGLMTLVIVKLFLVDLARVGTVGRIVSFLVVGGLMLVIGYFSPLPPKARDRS